MRIPLAAALALAVGNAAAQVSIGDFLRPAEIEQVSLAPDGRHLAVSMTREQRTQLTVLSLPDLKPVGATQAVRGQDIGNFWWADATRLVYSMGIHNAWTPRPEPTGELLGMDLNGSNQKQIFGYRAPQPIAGGAAIMSRVRSDPGFLQVAVHRWKPEPGSDVNEVYRLDARRGYRESLAKAPAAGYSVFLSDRSGAVRYATVEGVDNQWRSYSRADASGDWRLEAESAREGASLYPLMFSEDGRAVYLWAAGSGDKACLVRRELGGASRQELGCDPDRDLHRVINAFDGSEPIAVLAGAIRPELRMLPGDHPDKALLLGLAQALAPQGVVLPVSSSDDGSRIVLYAYSDRDPGQYYLYDRKTNQAQHLLSRRPWIDPARMAERRPFKLLARDGHPLHGVLTLPPGRPAEGLPLVVYPHGGLFSGQDSWGWDAEPQLLASRGYAVLQLNYRGSTGYGLLHRDAAKKALGSVVANDIIDATRWAIGSKLADGGRVCIFGSGYSAHAAVMGAVREPDLYRCVVAYAGIYDLAQWKARSVLAETDQGRNFIRDYFGDDATLAAQSPLPLLGRLRAPVLIAHSEDDRLAPIGQAKALRDELKKQGLPYEWLTRGNEGHYFARPENRVALYETALQFLDRNIGTTKGATP